MSLEGHARQEMECDFPNRCARLFDQTPGVRVAAIRNNDIVAFCRAHSAYLIMRGVNLRTLEAVRAEWRVLPGHPQEPTPEELSRRQEQEFIASLK